MSGIVRDARRPPGWIAPGPSPAEPGDPAAFIGEGEDLCWLAGNWRIVQRLDGHRWSLDDLVTAWFAQRACAAPPRRAIDLGCGIGTVLMFTAWKFPEARCLGVEAQALSAGLARRSLAWNGAAERCEVRTGDFRDPALVPEAAAFDLVTGTPPYFQPGSGTESDHVQRAPCRFEHRGGVEDYCLAAARLLAEGGLFVACESGSQRGRIAAAAAAARLHLTRYQDVIPKAGKSPLLSLFALRHNPEPLQVDPPLVVRDSTGHRTAEFTALRADMGMPP
ncbi:MAG TPA: methyltransferase [Kofleriaceae bacterium]|nr:methyltransferase [Kofleriaceae bacterium]